MDAENKVVLAEKSFYKWLNSYGWTKLSPDVYTGYGYSRWTYDGTNYDIRLRPFYLPYAGYYSLNGGINQVSGSFSFWSNTPATDSGSARFLGYDGVFVVPAWQGSYRRTANSLRCLTQ